MEDKIKIVNWLLTRKCNLNCEFCRIVKNNWIDKSIEYPSLTKYFRNQMSTEKVIEILKRLKKHNPDSFHIFYGGEPFLRFDLKYIIEYCNNENIAYTIITNNTDEIQKRIEDLYKYTKVMGISSSVDPILFYKGEIYDIPRFEKSVKGLINLKRLREFTNDVVAEITIDKKCSEYLPKLINELYKNDIVSSITFIDIAKNKYYDFSDITDENMGLKKEEFLILLDRLKKEVDEKSIHLGFGFLEKLSNILPFDMDCKIENDIHNLTIDADGSVRLCLRIRGIECPKTDILDYLNSDGQLDSLLKRRIKIDKSNLCQLCNWTCMLMSSEDYKSEEIIHSEKRK